MQKAALWGFLNIRQQGQRKHKTQEEKINYKANNESKTTSKETDFDLSSTTLLEKNSEQVGENHVTNKRALVEIRTSFVSKKNSTRLK